MPDFSSLFPKSFKARDFRDSPEVFTIESVEIRTLAGKDDSVSSKLCVKFKETNRFWFAGPGEACPSIAEALGSTNTDDWIGERIELFEDETDFGGEMVDCVRARKPPEDATPRKKTAKKKVARRSKAKETWPKHVGTNDDTNDELVQAEEGGEIYEINPEDLEGVLSGELTLE